MTNLILATLLMSATFSQPLPFHADNARLEIQGYVSNSLDPELAARREFVIGMPVGEKESFGLTTSGICRLQVSAVMDKFKHQVNIEVTHVHDVYDNYVDFIGEFEYTIKFGKYEIAGKRKLEHTHRLESPRDLFMASKDDPSAELEARYNPKTGAILIYDEVANERQLREEVPVIPHRSYYLEFEYMSGLRSYNVKQVWMRLRRFADGRTTWKVDPNGDEEIQLKPEMKWNCYRKVVHAGGNNILFIQFNFSKVFEDEDCAFAFYIKNAKLIPLERKNTQSGP